jgi:hypothetical protein
MFALSMIDGMETGAAALALLLGVILWLEEMSGKAGLRRAGYIASFVFAALCRPELAVVFPVLWIVRTVMDARAEPPEHNCRRPSWRHAIFYCAPIAALGLFNFLYYGDPIPNTFHAKQVPFFAAFHDGVEYVFAHFLLGQSWIGVALLMLGAATLYQLSKKYSSAILAVVILRLIFIVTSGGDWMFDGRFYTIAAPYFALLWVASGIGLIRLSHQYFKSPMLACAALCALVFSIMIDEARPLMGHEYLKGIGSVVESPGMSDKWRTTNKEGLGAMAEWMRWHIPAGDTVLTSEIGLNGVRNTSLVLVDAYGLTDKTIARFTGYPRGRGGVYCDRKWMLPGELHNYIERRHIDWVILSVGRGDRLAALAGKSFGQFKPAGTMPMHTDYGDFVVVAWRRER